MTKSTFKSSCPNVERELYDREWLPHMDQNIFWKKQNDMTPSMNNFKLTLWFRLEFIFLPNSIN